MLIRPLSFDFDQKKNFEPLFNDEVARGVGILFNRGTVVIVVSFCFGPRAS